MLNAIVLLAGFAFSAGANAQETGSKARFDALDRNADGYVSRDEGKDAEELHTRFSELDINNDGKLTREEYAVLEREARETAARNARDPQAGTRRSSAAGASRQRESQ